ncbi:MAG: sugar MFS transporter [Akkermansiaceae bacterium]|jgi:MFS transporter, FHS family, L-fucose permease|nr:sugar MFS transporter [Akkermansiaceae bacterium]MDP4722562.1 sugar MFS transporter [Akkermansiaceae bacterium]MDP4779291.1 sugar MFS transporter [Akkermansiaceae bacterium]MDP4845958.1 sugar MFS transporter [Akkermansiaceae bacterium]MDP4897339.1 sugar MFS transporter [Akkermansiaceae bacterium]
MSQNPPPSANRLAFSTVTTLFFMWGFISCMNDLLIPKFKAEFDLSQFHANLVQSFFFGAYFLISFAYFIISATKGDPINKIGYKNGLIAGLVLTGSACLIFVPAANAESYPLFLTALCFLGGGVTLIQIAANPYIAILGPESSASSRLNLSQGLNSLGYVLTPLIGGYFLFRGENAEGLDSVKTPYIGLAIVLFIIAAAIKFIDLPTFRQENKVKAGIKVFRHKHFIWGFFAIFFYVGAEVTVGSILVNYLEGIMGLTEVEGIVYLSFYWGGLMIGRLMGAISLSGMAEAKKYPSMVVAALISIAVIFISAKAKGADMGLIDLWPYILTVVLSFVFFRLGNAMPGRMVGLFATVATILSVLAMTTPGEFALWSIVGIGLFNSIMWSNIFTLSIRGLGEDTSQGSSLLVMMIVGGAILPAIQGLLMDNIGVRLSLSIVLVSYLYLAFFGFIGSKIGRKDATA